MPNNISLNTAQQEAVFHTEGPLLIIAGAGTGKTRVLTERIVHLVELGKNPDSILALTFTNKAAKEMLERVKERIQSLWPYEYVFPIIGTFHSLCVGILRKHASYVGLTRNFTILDRQDSLNFVKKAMEAEGIDPKIHTPSKVLALISKFKNENLKVEDLEATTQRPLEKIVTRVWKKYQSLALTSNSCDFDDLIIKTVNLLKANTEIQSQYRQIFQYILIDEYQDTNTIQYELMLQLVNEKRNICIVGDADQTIYTWRGAKIENIFNFEKDFPELKTIVLEENYRSTKTILTAANDIISKNKIRRDKKLFTDNHDGELITVNITLSGEHEASLIIETIKKIIKNGAPKKEIAVLYRANFQSRLIEEACISNSIPYSVVGTRFFERKEIKDMISFIRLAQNQSSISDLERIINIPKRGIGKTTLLKILSGKKGELPQAMLVKVNNFYALIGHISQKTQELPPSQLISFILKESGLEKELKYGNDDDKERLANIQELVSVGRAYDHLPIETALDSFLDNVSLMSDQDTLEDTDKIRLMTIHAAKGLEFDYVFIPGLETGLFPYEKGGLESEAEKEEERRLFYVALTRAKKQLVLSYAMMRTLFGKLGYQEPSEFLSDISPDLIETISEMPKTNYLEW